MLLEIGKIIEDEPKVLPLFHAAPWAKDRAVPCLLRCQEVISKSFRLIFVFTIIVNDASCFLQA